MKVKPLNPELIHFASHEIKSPLSTVKLFADILQGQVSDEKARRQLKTISQKVDVLVDRINNFADYLRLYNHISTPNIQKSDLKKLITDLVNAYPKKSIHLSSSGSDFSAPFDTSLLSKAILGLIQTISYLDSADHPIQIKLVQSDNQAVINVYKSAKPTLEVINPINPPNSASILQKPYHTLEFLLSSQIISLHQGVSLISSHPKRGIVCSVTLPLY